ncbi:MAG: single-stranded DNA-binding protein [Actinobacteria bacterium]|nr:single-stranded DNA-binding protein [Actinomycetota bacterium]
MDATIAITGNVGSEVQLREPREGLAYASFRLGCTPRSWRPDGWRDDETTWIGVVCNKSLALNVKSSINKGDPVVVVGRLRTERWIDADGVEQERLKLDAQSVGHDLGRGTSVFRRSTRPVTEEAEVSIGDLMLAIEEEPGDAAEEAAVHAA